MWPYLALFAIPAFQAILNRRLSNIPTLHERLPDKWRLVWAALVLMIGLRYQVGGDWDRYLFLAQDAANDGFEKSLSVSDPAYSLLNWVAAHTGAGVFLVNTIFAALFAWGLVVFCRNQPRPWLALVVAVPYLITVVAMGYSRQSAALGLVMLGIRALLTGSLRKFCILIVLAAAFHKSAVILIPLALFRGNRRWFGAAVWTVLLFALSFFLYLQETLDALVAGYIGGKYDASGAAVRGAMNAVPALLFLLWRRHFKLPQPQYVFWTWMAWGGLVLVALLFVSPSSVAVDRVAFYWIPLQIFVWSRVPDALGRSQGVTVANWVYFIVAYSALAHIVWLQFAAHAHFWLPYRFYPFVWAWQQLDLEYLLAF